MKRFTVLLSTLLLAGCSSLGRTTDRWLTKEGARMLPRPAPLQRGKVQDCGPEALCAIFTYYNKPADLRALEMKLFRPEVNGTVPTAIPGAVRDQGLASRLTTGGGFARIRDAVNQQCPSMIMVTNGRDFHFFVVVGYNDRAQEAICEHYDNQLLVLTYTELEGLWAPTKYWCAVILPESEEKLVEDARGFEEKNDYERAEELYRKALALNPDNWRARLGLGNVHLAREEHSQAIEHFEKAYDSVRDDPQLLNNLAHSLVKSGLQIPRAGKLADEAVEITTARIKKLEKELLLEKQEAVRKRITEELEAARWALPWYFGTLAQARMADGKLAYAIAAYAAKYDALPLTEPDFRAQCMLDMGRCYRKMDVPTKERECFNKALEHATDPALREEIQKELK